MNLKINISKMEKKILGNSEIEVSALKCPLPHGKKSKLEQSRFSFFIFT